MAKNYTYKLSIIIVNYNVEYFLDQCLHAVSKAIQHTDAEVIVVDNNSVDGSLKMLEKKYPWVHLIANTDNTGFSKANNQGIAFSNGEYILLLNPDTVVPEDAFEKIVDFMDQHPGAGGLGVRMIDGKGNFLPESKRGLPTPAVAFYNIFRLSKLFPKSARLNRYHLGNLSEFETNEVDVLSGAFMFMRKEALDKVGLLDETFFMYGEDIDLSYRLQLGGYKNYYFPDVNIIHYKGESTKKSSVNYVFIFYRAMVIFAQKHFSDKNARLFSILINLAIYFRAFLAICVRLVRSLFLPAIDCMYLIIGLYALTNYWKMTSIEFPAELIRYSIPIYALTWIGFTFFNGGYDAPVKLLSYLKGVFFGTLSILLIYAILPKDLQFSRLFIFIGAGWSLFYFLISRIFLHFAFPNKYRLKITSKKSFLVIGTQKDTERVRGLLKQTNEQIKSIELSDSYRKQNLKNEIDEIVFCSGDIPYSEIISIMSTENNGRLDFKIAPPDTSCLIGSNSIDSAGDLYILNLNELVSKENIRKKRLFDLILSVGLLISLPINIFFVAEKGNFIRNLFHVLLGNKSFVGFSEDVAKKDVRLPRIKKGIISPADTLENPDDSVKEKLNLLYARDYSMRKDFLLLIKSFKKLEA